MTSFDAQTIVGPQFPEDLVRAIVRERYGFAAAALKSLGSFQDQNFRVTDPQGRQFVFKIAHSATEFATLDLQNQALAHLAGRDAGFRIPQLIPTLDGATMFVAEHAGAPHFVRMLSYVPGQILAYATRAPAVELLAAIGRCSGALVRQLAGFQHPAGDYVGQWDLRYAPAVIRAFLGYVASPEARALIEHFLAYYEATAAPLLPGLPMGMIHGDITSYNTLVQPDAGGALAISGLVDFGDMVRSYTVGELAVAIAETVFDSPRDPLEAAAAMAGAFHSQSPLSDAELAVLFPLICLRRCVVAVSTAQQLHLDPDNQYVREVSAQDLPSLRRLRTLAPELAHALFRHACGRAPWPGGAALSDWLTQMPIGPVIESAPLAEAASLDLGMESELLADGVWQQPAPMRAAVERALAGAPGLGRYGEVRLHHSAAETADEPAALHLGFDLFVPAGTEVLAPLPGSVEQIGPDAVILRHAGPQGMPFFTRYARVRPAEGLVPGQELAAGRPIARVAATEGNQPLPPHLHLQLACTLINGELPGLGRARERAAWQSLCPDPSVLLGPLLGDAHQSAGSGTQTNTDERGQELPIRVHPRASASNHPSAAALLERRGRVVQQAQEYYYRRPMQIVRGWRQYLYDDAGRAYLDAINNVAHIGHCHPRAQAAARRQMALLNTNARFLYRSIVEYAERLTALLPAPLSVVFFTCSGSEANDLALRLARAYTRQHDVVVIDGEYHGNTTAVDEISTSLLDNPAAKQTRPWVHALAQPNLYHGRYRASDPAAGAKYAADARATIAAAQAQGRGIAAFLTESLLGSSGGITLPAGYLPALYAAVRAAGGLCVADEVQVGFGRMGTHFWAFETHGVVPDIVTLGKPIGNGHPLSAVVTTPAVAEAFRQTTTYFNTYGGNPVACEVGMAVLDVIEQEGLQANALAVGQAFKAALGALAGHHAQIGAVYGQGLYMGVELLHDPERGTPGTALAMRVAERMRELGVIVYPTGDHYNILKIKPPMVFTQANAEYFAAMLGQALSEEGRR